MAIQIIGARPAVEAPLLPEADVRLPFPGALPAAAPLFDLATVRTWMASPHWIVRRFAVLALDGRDDPEVPELLSRAVADPSEPVAEQAMRLAGRAKLGAVAPAIEARLRQEPASAVAPTAIRALAMLAPERLVELAAGRPKFEPEGHHALFAELARSKAPVAIEFLTKHMNRAGLLAEDRRVALYGAALLSGDAALAERAMNLALDEARGADPEAFTPALYALVGVAGLPTELADGDHGDELYAAALQAIEESGLEETLARELADAVRKRDVKKLVAEMSAPAVPEPASGVELEDDVGRLRPMLRVLAGHADAIASLPPHRAAIFLVIAIDFGARYGQGARPLASIPAFERAARTLEVSAEALAAEGPEAWASRLEKRSERDVRTLFRVLESDRSVPLAVLVRFVRAMIAAGQGGSLFELQPGSWMGEAVREELPRHLELAERLIVEALEKRPLEPDAVSLALELAPRVRTQRIAAAIGRRFYELRQTDRRMLMEAIAGLGDVRLLPFVASRSYEDEPEQYVHALLALLAGGEDEKAAEVAIRRSETSPTRDDGTVPLLLRCSRCKETLTYSIRRVFVSPGTKPGDIDPAFHGDLACKACKAEDTLELTETSKQLIATQMLVLLSAMERGSPPGGSFVVPLQIRVAGKPMGLGAALRHADAELARSPDSIRNLLLRARVRTLLGRKAALADAEALLAIDARSPEAWVAKARALQAQGNLTEAAPAAVEALRLCRAPDEPRTYDGTLDDATRQAEDTLLVLENAGVELPEIDLTAARARGLRRVRAAELDSSDDER